MFQQVTLVGNLGNDPQLRHTPNGTPVANFNVAVSRRWSDSDGQQQERTTWFRVTTWDREAENCTQYLMKGARVLVVGEMDDARAWVDKDGQPRAGLELVAQRVRFLTTRNGSEQHANVEQISDSDAGGGASGGVSDGDIPF